MQKTVDLVDSLGDRMLSLELDAPGELLEADAIVARILVFVHELDLPVREPRIQELDDVELSVVLVCVAGEVYNVGDTNENYRKLDIVELLNARFPDGKVEFVHKDEDPRDYRVSFEKFARSVEFEAEHTIAEGIDEVHSLLQSGLLDDPYAPAYRN